jgi:hypothetical protein
MPIYMQRCEVKPELGFLLLLDLRVPPAFDLELDSLLDVGSNLDLQGFPDL